MTSFHDTPALSRKLQLAALSGPLLGIFLVALDQTIVSVALPSILVDLHGSTSYVWVVAAYLIPLAAVAPVSATLCDQYGHRRVFLSSLAVFVIGSVLAGIAPSMPVLIASRVVQGLAGGGLLTGAFTVNMKIFPIRELIKWLGWAGVVFASSAIIGPLLGSYLVGHGTWRLIFLVNVPLAALAAVLIEVFLPEFTLMPRRAVDWLGVVFIPVATTPLVMALLLGGTRYPWLSRPILGLFSITVIAVQVFVRIELRAARRGELPILPMKLFRDRTFALLSLVIMLTSAVFFGAVLYLPLFLQVVAGRSTVNAGWLLFPLVAGVSLSSILAGRLVVKTGHFFLVGASSLVLTILALWPLASLSQSTSSRDLAAMMVVLGLGLGPGMSLYAALARELFSRSEGFVVMGATGFFRTIGGAIGSAVFTTVFSNHLTRALRVLPLPGVDPALARALRSPDAVLGGSVPSSAFARLSPTSLAEIRPTVLSYLDMARSAAAGGVSAIFFTAMVLSVIALVLFMATAARNPRP